MKLARLARASAAAVITLIAYSPSAEAHSPIKGLGTFYSQLLHPFAVPSHALLLIAAALMLGQQGRDSARIGLSALGLAFTVGLAVATANALDGVREQTLLFGAFAIGGVVSLDRRMPSSLTALIAAGAGIAIGLDSATNTSGLHDAVLALAGVTIGVLYLATLIAGLTVGLMKHWHRVGVRIAGSWIVAASILVLALSIAAPTNRATTAVGCLLGQPPPC